MKCLALSALIWLFPAFVSAAVVELKNGQRVDGTFKNATTSHVTIEVGGQNITVELDKVQAIYFGSAPVSVEKESPGRDALRALKALQSVTTAGIAFREYSQRVNDAKVTVDRALEGVPDGTSSPKRPLALAMEYYVLASSAWSASLTTNIGQLESVGAHSSINQCDRLVSYLANAKPLGSKTSKAINDRFNISVSLATVWGCASDEIADAERVMNVAK